MDDRNNPPDRSTFFGWKRPRTPAPESHLSTTGSQNDGDVAPPQRPSSALSHPQSSIKKLKIPFRTSKDSEATPEAHGFKFLRHFLLTAPFRKNKQPEDILSNTLPTAVDDSVARLAVHQEESAAAAETGVQPAILITPTAAESVEEEEVKSDGTGKQTEVTADIALKGAQVAFEGMKPMFGPSQRAAETIEKVDKVIHLKDSVSTFLDVLSTFNNVTDKISTIHPYVQTACTILTGVTKLVTAQVERDDAIKGLLNKMTEVYTLLHNETLEEIKSMKPVVQCICQQTLECSYFIEEYAKNENFRTRVMKNFLSGTDDRIAQYQRVFEELLKGFETRASLETLLAGRETLLLVYRIWDKMNLLDDIAQKMDLNSMSYAGGAGLNLSKTCLEGTRQQILDEITEWALSTDDTIPRILWLHGLAGKGKSTIAHTIAHRLKTINRLGSCFCFDRNALAQKRQEMVFSTIARDLSSRDEGMRRALAATIAQDISLRNTTDILQQWRELILRPAQMLSDAISGPIVIVIDALDESGDPDSRELLLRVLVEAGDVKSQLIPQLPANIRILLTSRPLPDIHDALHGHAHICEKSMDSISSASTATDILFYIKSKLASPSVEWLQEEQLRALAIASGGLFEWARLACEYINRKNKGGLTSKERFERIISRTKVAQDGLLDEIYRITLEAIIPEDSDDKGIFLFRFRSIMAQIIGTAESMPMGSLQTMRKFFAAEKQAIPIESIILPLGALLSGTTDSTVVRPLHASFVDYLTDESRSRDLFVDVSSIHYDLAFASLGLMQEQLKFNICRLPSSYLANSEVSDLAERIEQNISAELSYACRFWTDHLHRAAFAVPLAEAVRAFFGYERLLFWLEGLSLLNKVNTCYAALSRVIEWVTPGAKFKNNVEDQKSSYKDVANDAADAQRFVRVFGGSISFSSPHLYVSALPFSPKHSRISQKFVQNFPNTLKIVQGQQKSWPATQAILRGHKNTVASVAFSPDGRRIVSGSWDKTIRIWDSETGESVRPPLLGHENLVFSVAFSLDGKKIASGSSDGTVRLWDPETGETLLPPLKSRYDWVRSVAFSPDGKEIVSGSDDHTVRLWSTETGKQLHSPLEGHDGNISSATFSPDGRYIISGSGDRIVRLWDTENRQQLEPVLRGHSRSVNSVTFSPDGSLVASGSDDNTVCLWDVQTMRQLGEPLTGHTGSVYSVAFSPDGSRIISGSKDSTVRLWSVETRQQISLPLNGHEGSVSSVAFSPDGRRIVSGSYDNTLRIWDSESTEEELRAPCTGHERLISSIAFSPDGKQIASASWDKTIRIWNAETGELLQPSLEGHEGNINYVAFSTDGKQLVSGSDDNTLRVWDVEKGEQLGPPLEGHNGNVLSISFSPDGELIASGSLDQTIRLWKTDTWKQLHPPLKGHNRDIQSVAFAPNGPRIVSGSQDKRLRVWDVEERKALGKPFKGHENWVRSVVFSPDGKRIASGSDDKTICLWSAEEGHQFGSRLRILTGHGDWVFGVVFSSDGQQIISGSGDKTVRIWDSQSGQQLRVLRGHQGWIRTLAYSPLSRHIASGSDDRAIRIWDAETDRELRQGEIVLDSEVFSRSDKHLVCFSTSWTHSLRDNCGPSLASYMAAKVVEVDDQGWTRFRQDKKPYLLFWAPQPYNPQWLDQWVVRRIPAPEIELDLSRMAHGSEWHLCYDSRGT